MSDGETYEHVYTGPSLEKVFAMAAAAKAGVYNRLIYDDEAAAVPEENPAGYDLDTCSQKHSRMAAHQAQRIDRLAANVGALADAATELTQTTAILIDNIHARLERIERTLEERSAGR